MANGPYDLSTFLVQMHPVKQVSLLPITSLLSLVMGGRFVAMLSRLFTATGACRCFVTRITSGYSLKMTFVKNGRNTIHACGFTVFFMFMRDLIVLKLRLSVPFAL